MTFVLQPRRGVSTSRRCANCLHRWFGHSEWWCGKEGVKQRMCMDARAEGGDCGPGAKFYLEDEDQRYGR